MCSTFKTLAAAAVLRDLDQHGEVLARRIHYTRDDLVDGAPITGKEENLAHGMTVAELCDAAIRYSDSTMSRAWRAFSASRTELRLTPRSSISSASVGSGAPGRSLRSRISCTTSRRSRLFPDSALLWFLGSLFLGSAAMRRIVRAPDVPRPMSGTDVHQLPPSLFAIGATSGSCAIRVRPLDHPPGPSYGRG